MSGRSERQWLPYTGVVVLLLAGISGRSGLAGQGTGDPNEVGGDITERFAFVWDSVEVSAQRFNPSYTGRRDLYECERRISVVGKVNVLDTNDLVGMQVTDPDVLQVIGGDGSDLVWTPPPVRPVRQYQELTYDRSFDNPLVAEEPTLQPYNVCVSFCVDANEGLPSALSSFQWCAYALYAEDVIEVDVPFAASDDWLEVAPGLQIRVTKATVECCDYTYWTEVKCVDGIVRAFDGPLSAGEPTADYLVLRALLLDAEGQPISATEDDLVSPAIWSESVDSTAWNTASCGGRLLTFITQAEITSIRHVIVVHPYEVPIPFTLTDLSLPTFCP